MEGEAAGEEDPQEVATPQEGGPYAHLEKGMYKHEKGGLERD